MALSILKQTILLGLLDIRDNGPKEEYLGICANLGNFIFNYHEGNSFDIERQASNWLNETFPLWPKYSGNSAVPVPAPKYSRKPPIVMYSEAKNLWKFQYGALRYELLDFLIQVLVEEDRK